MINSFYVKSNILKEKKNIMMFSNMLLLAIFVLISCKTTLANDTYILAVGGTMKVYKGEHNSIQMKSEIVNMDVYSKYFEVEAKFIFKNNGPKTTVFMGFPENGESDNQQYTTNFKNYETTVNGKNIEAVRKILSIDEEYYSYKAYWVKEVQFDENEEIEIIVKYSTDIGNISTGELFCEYDFTGGNWYGKVDESILKLKLNDKYKLVKDKNLNPQLKYLDGYYIFQKNNWEAEYEFRAYFK